MPAAAYDYAQAIRAWTPAVIGPVVLATFVVLSFAFQAPLVATKAVLLKPLPIGATCGLTTLVFVDGHGLRLPGAGRRRRASGDLARRLLRGLRGFDELGGLPDQPHSEIAMTRCRRERRHRRSSSGRLRLPAAGLHAGCRGADRCHARPHGVEPRAHAACGALELVAGDRALRSSPVAPFSVPSSIPCLSRASRRKTLLKRRYSARRSGELR